ncbi:hypothetical protein, partial [Nonomuraea maheshkhaliensis]|uniref:hypothetical protein n=1 Tax=Nonomuraea maheshkhaliensis TaxID=419590 RepID=UPI0031F9C49E
MRGVPSGLRVAASQSVVPSWTAPATSRPSGLSASAVAVPGRAARAGLLSRAVMAARASGVGAS